MSENVEFVLPGSMSREEVLKLLSDPAEFEILAQECPTFGEYITGNWDVDEHGNLTRGWL